MHYDGQRDRPGKRVVPNPSSLPAPFTRLPALDLIIVSIRADRPRPLKHGID